MDRATSAVVCVVLSMVVAAPALARPHHHRRHFVHRASRAHVIPDVLVANPYGDVIIDGRTGFHRSDWGVMVPDSAPQSFVATGRASRTIIGGASGLPGRNWQDGASTVHP